MTLRPRALAARLIAPRPDPAACPPLTPRRAGGPLAVTLLIVALSWGVHLGMIDRGGISHYDEFFTLDRSASFAEQGDWLTVYSKGEPSFRKPPLQYWMIAGLMEAGLDEEVALRLPSMLFALGGLLATAALALLVMPWAPWAMPAAVLLYASSAQFWHNATSALLDAGAAFFAVLSLVTTMLALRRPGWWYGVALAIALGALQKAPVGLVLVPLYLWVLNLTRARHGLSWAEIKANRHFRIAKWMALAGVLAWPVFQSLLHGGVAIQDLYGRQMIERFAPAGPISQARGAQDIRDLIIAGEPVWRWLAIAALAVLPWRLRRAELWPLTAIFALYALAMLLANGSVFPRYTLIVLPLLAVALAAVVLSLFRARWVALAAVAAISATALGPVKGPETLGLFQSDHLATQTEILRHVGRQIAPDERLVTCNWNRETRFMPGGVSHYAANGRPFVGLDTPEQIDRYLNQGLFDRPLRGVCTAAELAEIAPRLIGPSAGETRSGYVIWTARGVR